MVEVWSVDVSLCAAETRQPIVASDWTWRCTVTRISSINISSVKRGNSSMFLFVLSTGTSQREKNQQS